MLERLRRLFTKSKETQDFATHSSKGEIAHADPLNLFPGGFQQFNPSDLVARKGLRIFDEMRIDDQVKAAMSLKKYAILSPSWEIVPKNNQVSNFVENALSGMEGRFEDNLWEILSALEFGYSINEKIWTQDDSGSVILKAIKGRKPHTFTFDVDEFGNILAVTQESRGNGSDLPRFDPNKFVIYSYQKEFGNPYGRALDPKTPIPTPDGWKCMDGLVEGSRVFDEEGKIRYVIGRKDWYDRPCYEVVFNTGSIIADSNHQWYTELPHQRGRGIVGGIRTTEDIANRQSLPFWKSGHSIPLTRPLEYSHQDLTVDPYFLGLWLGDGDKDSPRIASHSDDVKEQCGLIPYYTSFKKISGSNCYRITCKNGNTGYRDRLRYQLREIGVLYNKHIPSSYLRGSIEQRKALLEGLMDSDGHVNHRGECLFSNNNKEIIYDFQELISSLGIPSNVVHQGMNYRVNFTSHFPPFRLSRKISRCKESGNQNNHYIKSVNPVENRRTVCIQVDSPSRLFLAGWNMVPTHNSDLEAAYTPWWHKTNTLKWMAMFLERFGIPPIFGFYNPNYFSENQVEQLKNVLKNMQSSTTGLIPRPDSDAFDTWTPNSEFAASQTQRTFIPALDRQDQMIARALLMPGLIGLTPEGKNGSFARSQTHFGTFMIIIEAIQNEIARLVDEQIIRPMVDMNFPNADVLPSFRWLPLTDDMKIDLADQWATQVREGSVTPSEEDQDHIRRILNFPEKGDNRQGSPTREPDDTIRSPSDQSEEFQGEIENLENLIGGIEEGVTETISDKARSEVDRIINKLKRDGLNPETVQNMQSKINVKRDLKKALSQAFEKGKGTESKTKEESQFLETLAVSLASLIAFMLLDNSKEAMLGSLDRDEDLSTAVKSIRENLREWIDDENPSRVRNLVKTEVNKSFQKGKVKSVKPDSDIKGFRFVTDDGGDHQACKFMNGRIIPVGSKFLSSLRPPLHHRCRSTLVPVRDVDESEFITPAQAGRAIQLSADEFV